MKQKVYGFTIVELLVVIVVLAILAAITTVAFSGVSERASDAKQLVAVEQFMKQIQLYKTEHGEYPATPSGPAQYPWTNYFVGHESNDTSSWREYREAFEELYGIAIPKGVLYGRYERWGRYFGMTYVTSVFLNKDNIPLENRSMRGIADAQNRSFPQVAVMTNLGNTSTCPDPPVNKLTATMTPSTSNGAGLIVAGVMEAGKRRSGSTSYSRTSKPTDFMANQAALDGYVIPGYESCGTVSFMRDINPVDARWGTGMFVLSQGE